MTEVFIGLGSNLGNRLENINNAVKLLGEAGDIEVESVSSIIETDPGAGPPQPKYLNCVVKLKTGLSAQKLLDLSQSIEKKLKRTRTVKNGPRTIDLDILLYGMERIDSRGLKIPHSRMRERDFVMGPLREIEPDIDELIAELFMV